MMTTYADVAASVVKLRILIAISSKPPNKEARTQSRPGIAYGASGYSSQAIEASPWRSQAIAR